MPAYLKIFAYVAVALTLGALAAPPIFWAGQNLAAAGISDWLAGFPFHRVLSRCLQISLVALLWPALRWVGLRRPSELGLRRNPSAARDVVVGLLLAVGSVALMTTFSRLSGLLLPRPDPALAVLGRIFATAAAVSVLEEAVFRGVVLGVCLWTLSRGASVFFSALLFALVHFVKPAKTGLAPGEISWSSGLAEMMNFTAGLPSLWVLFFGFASLMVAGWILGQAAVRTRSLWLPIGIHAGWILAVQTSGLLFRPAFDGAGALPWLGPRLVSGAVPTGLLPLAGLILAGFLCALYIRYGLRRVERVF